MISTEPSELQMKEMRLLDQNTPFDMVNLLKYRDKALYESTADNACGRTGREAYNEYAKVVLPKIIGLGGSLVYRGQCNQYFVGDETQDYDELIIVRYPSRAAYLTMFSSAEYQDAIRHRKAGLYFRVLHGCEMI